MGAPRVGDEGGGQVAAARRGRLHLDAYVLEPGVREPARHFGRLEAHPDHAELLAHPLAIAPHEVEFVRLGRHEVVIVTVKLLAQRSEKTLVGACTVEQDVAQSVVYATLAAVNRVLGGLRAKEPVEYELRPTST